MLLIESRFQLGERFVKIWRGGLVVLVLSGLSACATLDVVPDDSAQLQLPQDSVVEANPDQIKVLSDTELATDPQLPNIDLDAPTLESLLVMNLASYQGQWNLAASKARATAQSTQDYRLARLATLLALRDNDYQQGLMGAKLWHELDPDGEDSLNMLMITQLGAGDTQGAIDSLQKHAQDRDLDSHIKQVAALLTRQKNSQAALDVAQHMIDEYDDSAQAALSASYVAEFFEDYDKSEKWVNKALALRPEWELAAQMNAKILQSQNKHQERADFIANYVQAHPQSVIMRINHASEMVRAGDIAGAYEYMQKLLDEAPRDTDALQYTGALAEDQQDYKQAARYYQRALNIDPSNDNVRWSLARRALIDEDYGTAERHFNDISDQELLFDAQIQTAHARYELYGLNSAINTLAMLEPRTEPEYVSLALTRHYLLMSEYMYEEALGAINEVLYYIPQNMDLVYARALVAAELKRLDIAEPDLRSIIDSQPDHANALNALGYTLADQTQRLEEAKELIEQALALRPNDAHILDSMGWVAYRLGDFETAIEYLEKAYAVSEEVEIGTHLAEVLWENGDRERAISIWAAWLQKEGENRLLRETLKRYEEDVDLSTWLANRNQS